MANDEILPYSKNVLIPDVNTSIARNLRKEVLKEDNDVHTFEFSVNSINELLTKVGFLDISNKYFLNTCFFKGKNNLIK